MLNTVLRANVGTWTTTCAPLARICVDCYEGESEEKIAANEARYQSLGRDGMLREGIDEMLQQAEQTGEWPWLDLAGDYAILGDIDLALNALEKALDTPSYFLTTIAVDAAWDPLRSDPRFTAMLERMGLEDTAAIGSVGR